MSSASIDERIVKLMFDNALFEKNAQTSISTLEKLKQALKLDDASKSLDALEKKLSNQSSLDKISSTVDSLKDRFSAGGIIGMRVLQNLTDSAMNFGKKMLDAINVPLEQIKQGGWTRAMNLEQAKFQIESLGASWEKVYKDMDFAVTGTAYGMDAAAKVAAQLTASGIEAGDEMAHVLRGISGVAAMTGSTYEDIGNIMATVAGNGRLYAQQLNQFAYRGLNATAVLAKKFNTTESEIRAMVKAGEIDFQTFAEAMYEAFGESAVRANELFSGALSNTKAALSRIGADVAANSLTNFRDVLNACRIAINNFHTSLGGPTSGLLGDINNVVTAVSQGLVKFMSDNRFTKAMDKFAKGLQNGFSVIVGAMTKIRDVMSVKFFKNQDANDVFLSLMKSFNKFTQSIASNKSLTTDIYHIFGGILTIIKQLGIAFGEVVGGVTKFFSSFQGLKVLNNLIKSFKNILMGVKSVLEPIGKAFMKVFGDTNWKWVTKASRKLKDFTKQLRLSKTGAKKVETVFTKLFTAIKKIGTAASDVAKGGLSVLGTLWEKLVPDDLGIKVEKGTREIEKRYAALPTAVGKATALVKKNSEETGDSLLTSWMKFFTQYFPQSDKFIQTLSNIKTGLDNLKNSFPVQALETFGNKVKDVFGTIKDNIPTIIDNLIKKFKNLNIKFENPITTLKRVGKAIGEFITKIKDIGKNIKILDLLKDLIGKISDKGEGAFKLLKKGINKIKEFIGELAGKGKNGLTGILESIGNAFDGVATKVSDFINRIDVSKLIAVGYIAVLGMLSVGLYNLMEGVGYMANGVGSFFKRGGELLSSLKPIKESRSTLESAAISITLVTASLVALSQIPFDKLKTGLAGLAAVMLGTTGFLGALEGLAAVMKHFDFGKEFTAISRTLPLLAVSVVIIAQALRMLNDVTVDAGLIARIAALTVVMVEIGALVAAIEAIQYATGGNSNSLLKNAASVVLFAMAIHSISKSLVKLSDIPFDKALNALKNSIPVFAMAAMVAAIIGKLTIGSGIGFVAGVAGLQLLVMVLENLAKKDWNSMLTNLTVFGKVLGVTSAIVVAISSVVGALSKLLKVDIGKTAQSFGVGMIAMAGAVYLTAVAIEKLGNMDPAVVSRGGKVVSALIVVFGLFSILSRLGKAADYKGMAMSFFAVGIAINGLVAAIYLLGSMDVNTVKRGTIAVGALITFMGLFAGLTKLGKGSTVDARTLVSLSGAVIVLGLSLVVLAQLDWDEVKRGLTAMGVALAEFTAAFVIIQKFGSMGQTSAKDIALVIALAIAAGGLTAALTLLASYDWKSLLAAATAMGECLLAITAAFIGLNNFGPDTWKELAILIAEMGIAIVTMLGISYSLTMLATQPWESIEAAGNAMAKTLLAITAALSILTFLAPGDWGRVATVAGTMAIGVVAVHALTQAIMPLTTVPVASLSAACDGISELMISLGLALGVVGAVATVSGPAAATGAGILLGTIGVLVVLVGAIGAACTQWSSAETAITKGLEVLGRIGEGIGTAIGKFVNGIINTVVDNLPHVADQLSSFTEALKPFIKNISKVDENTVKSAKLLADVIKTLSTADLMNGFKLFSGEKTSMDDFSSNSVKIGEAVNAFAKTVSGLSDEDIKKSKIMANVAMSLVDFAKSVPREGGLFQSIIGENGFATFAQTLADNNIGAAIAQFANDVAGIDSGAVEKGAAAGKMIADFANSIGNDGGLLADLIGDNKLSDFAAQLVGDDRIGVALATFANDVAGIDSGAVEKGATAGKLIADFANSISNEGGILADLIGDNTLSNLATGLMDSSGGARIGAAIATFVQDMEGISKNAAERASSAGLAVSEFADAVGDTDFGLFDYIEMQSFANMLTTSGIGSAIAQFVTEIQSVSNNGPEKAKNAGDVVLNFITGVNDAKPNVTKITGIAEALTTQKNGYTVGQSIRAFESSIASLNVAAVTRAQLAADVVTTFLNGLKSVGSKSIPNFGKQLVELGKCVKEFSDELAKINSEGIKNVSDAIIESIKQFSETSISTAITEMTTKASDFATVGNEIVKQLQKGLTDKQTELTKSAATLVANAAKSLKSSVNYAEFKSAGNYLAEGFAKGMTSGSGAAAVSRAGSSLAQTAVKAIKKEAVIKSPSQVTEQLGIYTAEGYENGIVYGTVKVKQAASNMVGSVIDAVKSKATPMANVLQDTIGQFTFGTTNGLLEMTPALNTASTAMTNFGNSTKETGKAMEDTKKKSKETTDAVKEQKTFWDTIADSVQAYYDAHFKNKETQENATKNMAKSAEQVAKLGENILDVKNKSSQAASSVATDAENTKSHIAEVTDAFKEFRDAIASSVDSSMNLFEAKEKQEDISSKQMIKNMASQVHAVMNWESNIKKLSKSGIEQGLLMELAKLGPEGAAKVKSFVGMTDKELSKVNHLYRKYLSLKGNTADEIVASMANVGKSMGKKLASGIDTHAADQRAKELGINAETALKAGVGISTNGGESESTKIIGMGFTRGVSKGIEEGAPEVAQKVTGFTNTMTTTITSAADSLSKTKAVHILQPFSDGIDQDKKSMQTKLDSTFKEVTVKVDGFSKKFQPAGEASIEGYAKGMTNKKNSAKKSVDDITKTISTTAEQFSKKKAPTLGTNLTLGFANGMTSKKAIKSVEKAAKKVVSAAIDAIYDAADEGSPSRLSAINGKWLTEGLAVGMRNRAAITSVKDAASTVVDAATGVLGRVSSVGEALSSSFSETGLLDEMERIINDISNSINDNMNASPLVIPQLDLSRLERDAQSVGRMFDNVTVGTAVSSMEYDDDESPIEQLGNRIEMVNNASSDAVVNAVNQLRQEVGSLSRQMNNLQVVMDTGTLVGAIGPEMDSRLGMMGTYRGRGI